jgi:hypothetical protein
MQASITQTRLGFLPVSASMIGVFGAISEWHIDIMRLSFVESYISELAGDRVLASI